jgi:hypothetical protein
MKKIKLWDKDHRMMTFRLEDRKWMFIKITYYITYKQKPLNKIIDEI